MLPDTLTAAIRDVGEAHGGVLLLDANKGRALLTDAARALDVCRNLRRAGFTRFVDFTGAHNGADSFMLYLTLRAPAQGHARLTLKWKWKQAATNAPCDNAPRGAGQPGDKLQAGPVDSTVGEPLMAPAGGMNAAPTFHPSLSVVWPAAATAEREIFEMLGIPFAGNALEPLLLDEAFVGHPLRKEFEFVPPESYVQRLAAQRHAEGLIDALVGATRASPEQRNEEFEVLSASQNSQWFSGDARVAPTASDSGVAND